MKRIPGASLPLVLACLAAGCTGGDDVDGARALARVTHQVQAGPRIPGTPGHRAVMEWIAGELARLGARVERQTDVDSTLDRPLPMTNLIGRYGPASGRPIVLAAHWDTRPWCDQDPDSARRNEPVPGANDAGSGVAVLLEVAERLHRTAPRVPVELVFFDAEDQGRATHPDEFSLGARAYARRLASRSEDARPKAAFVFDMVGDRDLEIHPEIAASEQAANLVALANEGARATGGKHFHPEPRYRVADDHTPLLEAGIPAVDIIDFDYPAWHTARDLPDQVSAESLAEVSRVAIWLVLRSPLARNPRTP